MTDMERKEIYKQVLAQKEALLEITNFTLSEKISVKGLVVSIKKYFTNPELVEITAIESKNSRPVIWIDLIRLNEFTDFGYLTENSQNINPQKALKAFRAAMKTYILFKGLPNFIGVYEVNDNMVGALHKKNKYKRYKYNYWLISNNSEFKGYI
jgi:hypothetical protein